jgi:hypothetical protein
MKGLKLVAFTGAIACLFPTAAIAQPAQPTQTAQPSPTDIGYLNDLYQALEQEDAFTYEVATQFLTNEDHIWVAQTFCQAFDAGMSPADTFITYMTAAIDEADTQAGGNAGDDVVYALSLHSSMVMALGTAYYCPQHQEQVNGDLEAIANGSLDSAADGTAVNGPAGKPVKF